MRPEQNDTEWVPPPVAAERLGLATSSVISRIRRGDLEAHKNQRGHWRVRLPVLSAIAAQAPRRGTLTVEAAVAMAGVPSWVLWTAVHERRLPVLRRGGELRFDPADVAAWLETQRVPRRHRESRSQPITAIDGEELLTIEAAAARMGVAPATLWRWLNVAGLPFVLAPGIRQRAVRHVRPSDLERLAAERRIKLRRAR